MTITCDPLEQLVGSLARPGGGADGFSCVSSDLAGKRLSFLKQLVPNLRKVALLYTSRVAFEPDLQNTEKAALVLGVSVARFDVNSPQEFEMHSRGCATKVAQAVYISLSAFANFHRRTIADLALRNGLPAIFGFREFADDGGLITYGASNSDGYRRAAYFVDKILKGVAVTELPAEEPTRFQS